MNRHTAMTMRALGFAPRADAVENEPAAQPAPRQANAVDCSSSPPPSNHGWDTVAATLITEAGMQNAPTGGQS